MFAHLLWKGEAGFASGSGETFPWPGLPTCFLSHQVQCRFACAGGRVGKLRQVAKWTVSGPCWGVMQQAQPLHSFATYPFTDPGNGYEGEEGSVVTDVLPQEIGFTWYPSRWVGVRPPCGSCARRLKILHSPQSWMTHVSRSCGPAPGVGGRERSISVSANRAQVYAASTTTTIVILDNDNGSYSALIAYSVPGSVLNAFLGCIVLIANSESELFL